MTLAAWERVYRRWKADEVPPFTCPDIDAVRDVLATLDRSPEVTDALDALERVREANEQLRAACKAAMRLALAGVERERTAANDAR